MLNGHFLGILICLHGTRDDFINPVHARAHIQNRKKINCESEVILIRTQN